MKRLALWFATSCLLFTSIGFATAASTSNKLQTVLDRGYLIVGTGSTNPPWHFINKDGGLVGFDIAISRIIANGLFGDPSKVKFVDQSDASRIPNLTTGKVDITCQFMTVTAERANVVAFTIPYYREGVGLLLMKDGSYDNYKELKAAGSDVTVSVLQNVYAEKMVHVALPKAQVQQYKSPNLMYQALASGRANAAATDMSSLSWYMAQNPGRYKSSGYGWFPQNYSCAVKQGQPVWLNYLNTVLRQAMTGVAFPAYASAFQKWFGTQPPAPEIGFPR